MLLNFSISGTTGPSRVRVGFGCFDHPILSAARSKPGQQPSPGPGDGEDRRGPTDEQEQLVRRATVF